MTPDEIRSKIFKFEGSTDSVSALLAGYQIEVLQEMCAQIAELNENLKRKRSWNSDFNVRR
jgi:hypothetical protein